MMVKYDCVNLEERKWVYFICFFYCGVHWFKQERGRKHFFNGIIGNTKLIQHRFIKSFVLQLGRFSHFEKIKVVSIEQLKQMLSRFALFLIVITTNVVVIIKLTSQKLYCFRYVGMLIRMGFRV